MFNKYSPVLLCLCCLLGTLQTSHAQTQGKAATSPDKFYQSRTKDLGNFTTGLDFPYADPAVMAYLMCFGLTEWSEGGEIHGGVDLVPHYDLNYSENINLVDPRDQLKGRLVELIAPTDGTVIVADPIYKLLGKRPDAPDKSVNKDFLLLIEITPRWNAMLFLEPKIDLAKAPSWVDMQEHLIEVKPGQQVRRGDRLGYLIVGGTTEYYPHVHYSLVYRRVGNSTYPDETVNKFIAHAQYLYPRDIQITDKDAPWNNFALNDSIAGALFCPYEFSTTAAKAIFDSIEKHDKTGTLCTCVCLDNSISGNCGDCPPTNTAPQGIQPPGNLRITQ